LSFLPIKAGRVIEDAAGNNEFRAGPQDFLEYHGNGDTPAAEEPPLGELLRPAHLPNCGTFAPHATLSTRRTSSSSSTAMEYRAAPNSPLIQRSDHKPGGPDLCRQLQFHGVIDIAGDFDESNAQRALSATWRTAVGNQPDEPAIPTPAVNDTRPERR